MACLAIDRNKTACRCAAINDTRFCKFHDYMTSYTDEMIAKLDLCAGCKKAYYFETATKTCDKCKSRSKTNRVLTRETVVLCGKQGCKFKRCEENKYCKLHQIELFVDETREENKKLCANYVRGCREKLELEYGFSRCQTCLASEREKDRAKRGGAKIQNAQIAENPAEKNCTVCCKTLPIAEFAGIRKEYTETCRACREQNRIQDQKRDKEHRNEIARVNDAKPERVEVKKQWKEDNYEKVAEYCMNSRQHKIEKDGVDEYLKLNAEQAKKWRENNPEKVKENNENKINSYHLQYGVYMRSAEQKQLEFSITLEEFKEITKKPCDYCAGIQPRGFNGIDRIDSKKGYVFENCVSCCKVCNYMKNTLNKDVFIHRVEHILSHLKQISGKKYPELFGDHTRSTWASYRDRALKKHFDFTIPPDKYKEITSQNCYLCGKQNTETHKNGIDRFDNSIGYIFENCRPCCGECNYMKRDYTYDEFIEKLNRINVVNENFGEDSDTEFYEKTRVKDNDSKEPNVKLNGDDKEPLENTIIFNDNMLGEHLPVKPPKNNTSLQKGNKKTAEEIKEYRKNKKRMQREALRERYGDEEYKKLHAKKIAEYRKNKKEKED
jgi:hypothetical protein